ncbi:MAG: hypothetical protein U9N80_04615 [Chloroflexota bacterium]|nr:hypothetical protein [Chloroflexota bacterium]
MTITIEIPPDIENRIRKNIALGDVNTVRVLLTEALTPTVEALMHDEISSQLSDEKFEALSDQLADELLACADPSILPLSDYAVSREGLYEDHL